jgi:hypothetical protein
VFREKTCPPGIIPSSRKIWGLPNTYIHTYIYRR